MKSVTNKSILSFFIKNFVLSGIYIYGMVAIYYSSIKIESLFIGLYQMAFTIVHIIVLLLLMIISAPKSKKYTRALLYYAIGILAPIIVGWSYSKINILFYWYI